MRLEFLMKRDLFYITESERIFTIECDFSLIDTLLTIKDAAVYTRKIALEEGISLGTGSGARY
jgi:cystathionine beta-synthase